MKRWLLALALVSAAWADKPKVSLLRSENTFKQLGWKARWEWQGAKTALEHLGLQVEVVNENQLGKISTPVLVMCNARNLEESSLNSVRKHLAGGGKVLASYQTSYKKADNTSWDPNGLALGPELGVKFLRWNGTAGETEALKLAPPYGLIPLARHQAMLVEASPESYVLAQWDKPADAPSIVQKGGAIYLSEDLLVPENSHSKQVLGLLAGLLNRLDSRLHLSLPKSSPPLVDPQLAFAPLPLQPGESLIKVGLGTLVATDGALDFSATRTILSEKQKPLGKHLHIVEKDGQLVQILPQKEVKLGTELTLSASPYLNCWQENANDTVRWSAYRGTVTLKAGENGITAINQLPADAYLAGVIPSEVPFTFPAEALKAMAVVARTYALSHLGRHSAEGFDVCSEVHCQVYRGLAAEHPYTTAAIGATRGELLKFHDKPADCSFHACCGGHGVDARDTWPGMTDKTYLAGTYDQLPASPQADLTQEAAFRGWLDGRYPAYCSGAGRFRWEETMAWSQLEGKLKESVPVMVANATITSLKNVEVIRRDRSGRVAELKLSADPADVTLGGDSVRWLTSGGKIGAGGLQSSLFYLDIIGTGESRTVRLRGGGWGHGVGLCQEGAAGRARAGQSYRQLLMHYYPGTVLLSPEPVPTQVFP
ncbi:MAG: SpoIID/LytB domain-containing protein [Vulcanimicrobiota bacterium]